MRRKNFIFIFLIVLIIFVLINISVIFIKISNFKKELTGAASGYVNLTINQVIAISITRDVIDWGSGTIDSGEKNATLYTRGDDDGMVERGNWTGSNAKAFIVENTGSINASLSIQAGKNAATFFGAVGQQQYMWNVTNKESGSCSGGATLGQWADVNTTSGGTKFCAQFDYADNGDEVYLDLLLTVPYNATNIGEQSDTIIITGNAAG